MAANSVEGSSIGGHSLQVGSVGRDLFVGSALPYGGTAISDLSVAVPEGQVDHEIRGRSELLADLAGLVRTAGGRFVLCGAGGYGKTTVAYALARELRCERDVWWVDATTREAFLEGLREVAVQAGASRTVAREVWRTGESAKDLLWRTLNRPDVRPWLLIVDNADEPEWVVDWIRRPAAGNAVLVTTRDGRAQSWWKDTELRAVGPLCERDGADVLLELAPGAGPVEDARGLARRLAGLPLALMLVGNYLAEISTDPALPGSRTPRSFAAFGSALDTAFSQVLSSVHQRQELTDRQVLSHTWELSLDLLESRGMVMARPLLRLMSFFNPSLLPAQVLKPGLIGTPRGFSPEFEVDDLEAALKGLVRFGLLRRERVETSQGAVDAFAHHPLIGEVTRSHPDVTEYGQTYRTLQITLLNSTARELSPEDWETWPIWRLLLLQCDFQDLDVTTLAEGEFRLLAELTYLAGKFTQTAGQWIMAEGHFRNSLSFWRKVEEETHPNVLALRQALAYINRDRGRLQEAESEFRSILNISRRELGHAHHTTLATRHELARVLYAQGDLEAAEVEFSSVASVMGQELGPKHRSTLAARHELARVLRDRGKLDDAAAEFRALLHIMAEALGPEAPLTLTARNELAFLLRMRGELDAAHSEFSDLLAVESRVQGTEHPSTLVTRAGLAELSASLGKPDVALDEFRHILDILTRNGMARDLQAINAHEGLARTLTATGNLEAAEREYRHVLLARIESLGSGHPDSLITEADLVRIHLLQGDHSTAEAELRSLHPRVARSLGKGNALSFTLRQQLVELLQAAGRVAEAEAELRDDFAIAIATRGSDHPETLRIQGQICGLMLRREERISAARRKLEELVPQLGQVLGELDEHTLAARVNLGSALAMTGHRNLAVAELLTVFRVAKRALGNDHSITLMARSILNDIA